MPTAGRESPIEQTKGALLAKVLTDAQLDLVTGRKPVSSWADTLTTWRQRGGDQVRQEYERGWQAR